MHNPGPMIAVANAGSSSLKFALYRRQADGLRVQLRGTVEELDRAPRLRVKDGQGRLQVEQQWDEARSHDAALQHAVDAIRELIPGIQIEGVGHRVVHGGAHFDHAQRVTPALLDTLDALSPLAPLHQPFNVAPMRLALRLLPGVPQVACFDTAFHRSVPELAQWYALPHELFGEGVRRYGFHGLSYEYVASRLPALLPAEVAAGRVAVLHLGNGASGCALRDGKSLATTMGFTALEGLVMGTRCGSVDAGVLLYLMDRHGMDARALEQLLYQRSGLLGVSGLSSDMRVLQDSDEPRARLAVDLFVYRVVWELGSLVAALGGLDALVFTAGIGEHAAPVRARIVEGLGWLGLELDAAANAAHGPRISRPGSRCSAWVIPTDEELMIATHTARVLDVG
jgi:acetate kinase